MLIFFSLHYYYFLRHKNGWESRRRGQGFETRPHLEPQVHFYILHLFTIQGDEGVGACDADALRAHVVFFFLESFKIIS